MVSGAKPKMIKTSVLVPDSKNANGQLTVEVTSTGPNSFDIKLFTR